MLRCRLGQQRQSCQSLAADLLKVTAQLRQLAAQTSDLRFSRLPRRPLGCKLIAVDLLRQRGVYKAPRASRGMLGLRLC